VSDTGVGIPLAEQDKIFDRFYRCERSIDDAAQGAGMGLAIAKAVVERHGGTIGVEAAPDEGTTMTVTFPVVARVQAHAV
jgi:two-component system, OmpR family, phosphate regulon sensor histidine kinase PhoR